VTTLTSKLALADLLSKLDIRLLDLPTVLDELILGDDRLLKMCYQTIGVLLVMLDRQQRHNRHQSNLVKRGVAVHPTPRLYSPGGSSNMQLHVLAAGFDPKSPLTLAG